MGILDRWDRRNTEKMENANTLKTYDEFNAAQATDDKWGRVAHGVWSAQALRAYLIGMVVFGGLIVAAIRAIF